MRRAPQGDGGPLLHPHGQLVALHPQYFPTWHIQVGFEVFKLPSPITMVLVSGPSRPLTCLAEFREVDPVALFSKYDAMVSLANDKA